MMPATLTASFHSIMRRTIPPPVHPCYEAPNNHNQSMNPSHEVSNTCSSSLSSSSSSRLPSIETMLLMISGRRRDSSCSTTTFFSPSSQPQQEPQPNQHHHHHQYSDHLFVPKLSCHTWEDREYLSKLTFKPPSLILRSSSPSSLHSSHPLNHPLNQQQQHDEESRQRSLPQVPGPMDRYSFSSTLSESHVHVVDESLTTSSPLLLSHEKSSCMYHCPTTRETTVFPLASSQHDHSYPQQHDHLNHHSSNALHTSSSSFGSHWSTWKTTQEYSFLTTSLSGRPNGSCSKMSEESSLLVSPNHSSNDQKNSAHDYLKHHHHHFQQEQPSSCETTVSYESSNRTTTPLTTSSSCLSSSSSSRRIHSEESISISSSSKKKINPIHPHSTVVQSHQVDDADHEEKKTKDSLTKPQYSKQKIGKLRLKTSCTKSVANQNQNGHNKGWWTEDEHERFLQGLKECGNNWKLIAEKYVKSRSRTQVASHGQKWRQSCEMHVENVELVQEN
ncbi:hypothetical protein FDP41_010688 [Naegleria fowleri]|uniref:Uncharacterized protein n=1 Tax=Naegleria fowleri TaxID=5763 RepID=A0A6A5BZN9_NAEFO|nr:uncharacterized protein FDP41_010688 [Naegleria fowleri]KAF0983623.1 hypothetical protein FDP41_010688 [Naegleria fowleri]